MDLSVISTKSLVICPVPTVIRPISMSHNVLLNIVLEETVILKYPTKDMYLTSIVVLTILPISDSYCSLSHILF